MSVMDFVVLLVVVAVVGFIATKKSPKFKAFVSGLWGKLTKKSEE